MDPLRWAKFYASIKHAGQTYGGNLPYTHHLAAVEAVLRRFRFDGTNSLWFNGGPPDIALLEAAWLHDAMEDCGVKAKEISELFGDEIAKLVEAVTNEPGPNRKVRAALTYPKIRNTPGATTLKLADRIANVESGGKLLDMYKREYEDFKRALYVSGENEAMWAHLDKLLSKT